MVTSRGSILWAHQVDIVVLRSLLHCSSSEAQGWDNRLSHERPVYLQDDERSQPRRR